MSASLITKPLGHKIYQTVCSDWDSWQSCGDIVGLGLLWRNLPLGGSMGFN